MQMATQTLFQNQLEKLDATSVGLLPGNPSGFISNPLDDNSGVGLKFLLTLIVQDGINYILLRTRLWKLRSGEVRSRFGIPSLVQFSLESSHQQPLLVAAYFATQIQNHLAALD